MKTNGKLPRDTRAKFLRIESTMKIFVQSNVLFEFTTDSNTCMQIFLQFFYSVRNIFILKLCSTLLSFVNPFDTVWKVCSSDVAWITELIFLFLYLPETYCSRDKFYLLFFFITCFINDLVVNIYNLYEESTYDNNFFMMIWSRFRNDYLIICTFSILVKI